MTDKIEKIDSGWYYFMLANLAGLGFSLWAAKSFDRDMRDYSTKKLIIEEIKKNPEFIKEVKEALKDSKGESSLTGDWMHDGKRIPKKQIVRVVAKKNRYG